MHTNAISNNKVAVITGGAAGIGLATATLFKSKGIKVVLADKYFNSSDDKLRKLVEHKQQVLAVKTDTSSEDDVKKMVDETIKNFSKIDILVNCAAIFIMKGVQQATLDDWIKVISVNVAGYSLCAKYCIPHMIKLQSGAIVNVSSISAHVAQPEFVTYSASKGAVSAMTRCMALDLAKYNIRVNAINPGTVWTDSCAKFIKDNYGLDRKQTDEHEEMGKMHMLGRVADPIEIAEAIYFLASDSSSFVTGENLLVDGGYTAW